MKSQITKTQVKKYENDFEVVLSNEQKREAVDRAIEAYGGPVQPEDKKALICYVTGPGNHSKAHLMSHFNIGVLNDYYKKEERKMEKEVEKAIRDMLYAETKAKRDAEFEEYKKFAKDFLENKNVGALEDAISVYGVPKDPVEALAQVFREYVRCQNGFYKDYR